MFSFGLRIGITTLVLAATTTMGGSEGLAHADGVRVVVPLPFFVPAPQFEYDGYYRTHGGRYYHYDRDRDGWHYGRNHGEGERYEWRHKHGKRH